MPRSVASSRTAFIRGGIWALVIGVPLLALPLLAGWLRPGPTDPRVYSNLLLIPVFSIPIFVFGGFIGMFRFLSRQAQAGLASAPVPEPSPPTERWAHERTHGAADAGVDSGSDPKRQGNSEQAQ